MGAAPYQSNAAPGETSRTPGRCRIRLGSWSSSKGLHVFNQVESIFVGHRFEIPLFEADIVNRAVLVAGVAVTGQRGVELEPFVACADEADFGWVELSRPDHELDRSVLTFRVTIAPSRKQQIIERGHRTVVQIG